MKKLFGKALLMLVVVLLSTASCAPAPTPLAMVTASPVTVKASPPVISTVTLTPVERDIEVDITRLKGLQIRFLHPWTGETLELLYQMVDQFNQTNEWGIHVIMTAAGSAAQVSDRINEELVNNIASNVLVAPVDLLLAIDEAHKQVVDLSGYAASSSFRFESSLLEDFNKTFWNEGLVDGKLLGIPAQQSALLMAYNSSWGRELGFTAAPRTVQEFSAQVCAANASFRKDADVTNDGLGGWIISMDAASVYNWLLAFGDFPYADGRFTFSTPAAQEAFTFLYNLNMNACAWMNRSAADADRFLNREALTYTLWMQDMERLVDAMKRAGATDDWMVMAYPSMQDETLLTRGSSYAVLHQDAESDLAAWLFISWLAQPAQQARLLATMGTLPLGNEVMAKMEGYGAAHPYWQQVVTRFNQFAALPVNADWQVIAPMVEDAAWQLWMGGTSVDGIPDVLAQMDDLAVELSERYP